MYTLPRRVGDVEGRAVLSNTEARPSYAPDRLFIAKIEMATRCRGVGGEEVGVKCGFMQVL